MALISPSAFDYVTKLFKEVIYILILIPLIDPINEPTKLISRQYHVLISLFNKTKGYKLPQCQYVEHIILISLIDNKKLPIV